MDWLELTDFRSYPGVRFEPAPGLNVLVGPNGAGKTTLLEAIGYLSTLRSFRGVPDAALIRTDATAAVVRGGFRPESGETTVAVEIPAQGRRRVLVNGKRPRRLADVAGLVPVVAFLPDDLDLVKASARVRRDYVDDLGVRLSPAHAAAVDEYGRNLRQRNTLLRRDGPTVDEMTLEVIDGRLGVAAAALWQARRRVVTRLGPVLREAHRGVAGEGEPLILTHSPAWGAVGSTDGEGAAGGEEPVAGSDETASRLVAALAARRRRELEQRTTTLGPHRDDVALLLRTRDARTQASQGEQRSVAVALRVAAYRLLEEHHGHPPVLLLDDVFSELDLARTTAVADMLPRGQVFVTTTREDEVPSEGRRWDVAGGAIDEGPGASSGGGRGGTGGSRGGAVG